ncbi:Down syndrome cell adhesion molecule homolog isoform X2 [Ixodes scapularis]|uniref:Down syndrome cell adhesion molecule homolog isoform X2 n=1 Tax=Ixodes scapularis TaxID=6945 RepID=UPI001A9F5350|nr:Down syndrome cell adhesion molecule homolog isoform X2 [Ixodes scapularis]
MKSSSPRFMIFTSFFCAAHLSYVTSTVAPKLQEFFFPSHIALGKKAQVYCAVYEGNGPFSFSWKKDGLSLDPAPGSAIRQVTESTSLLILDAVAVGDIGNYTCVVSSGAGSDSYTASLHVKAAPVWSAEPADAEAIQGKDLYLPCGAVGYPKPSTAWKMQLTGSREFIPLHTMGRQRIHDNGTLVIEAVEAADAGVYRCEVANGIEPSLGKTFSVSVHVPPAIAKGSNEVSVKRGDIAKIACDVTGEHPLLVTWEKDGAPLVPSVDRYETHEDVTPTGVQSVLVIHNTIKKDASQYVCIAKNDYGKTRDVFRLVVLEPPESPSNVVVTERGSRYVQLKWTQSSKAVTRYLVRYWRKSSKGSVLQEREVDGLRPNLMVSQLHPGTEYAAVVLAENSVGFGEPSDPVHFTTASEEPGAPPMNVKCEPIDTKTVKVTWEAPPTDKQNGDLRGYYISYKLEGTPFSHETVNRNSKHKLFGGLQAASVYTFSVKAFNDVDSGPASEEVSCATLNGDPPSIPSVRVTGITSSSVSLNWNTPANTMSPVIQYLVQYGSDDEEKSDLHLPGNKDTVTLRDLRSGTRYNFRLAAYNMYGRGDFSHNLPAVTHLSDGRSLQTTTESEVPFYYRTYFVVPVAASFTVIITAVVIAWACLKRATIIQKNAYRKVYGIEYYGDCKLPPGTPLVSQYARGSYAPTMEHPRNSQGTEEAYDVPWDGPPTRTGMINDGIGSYARLKTQGKRNIV